MLFYPSQGSIHFIEQKKGVLYSVELALMLQCTNTGKPSHSIKRI